MEHCQDLLLSVNVCILIRLLHNLCTSIDELIMTECSLSFAFASEIVISVSKSLQVEIKGECVSSHSFCMFMEQADQTLKPRFDIFRIMNQPTTSSTFWKCKKSINFVGFKG